MLFKINLNIIYIPDEIIICYLFL